MKSQTASVVWCGETTMVLWITTMVVSPRTPRLLTKGWFPSALRTRECRFNKRKMLGSIPVGQHHRQVLESDGPITVQVFWTAATSLAPLREQEGQIGEAHDAVTVEIRV